MALVAVLGAATTERTLDDLPSEVTSAFVEPANCGTCEWCLGGHEAPLGGSDIRGLHTWCMQLAECSGHPDCGAAAAGAPAATKDEVFSGLLRKAIDGDYQAQLALLEQFPGRAEINVERMALQVAGCNEETIAAHIPLSRRQIVSLFDAADWGDAALAMR